MQRKRHLIPYRRRGRRGDRGVGGEHEALLEVIGSVGMHTYFATRAADGTIAAREVHRHGVPWDAPPPAGLHTTAGEMGEIVAGTIAPGPASAPV